MAYINGNEILFSPQVNISKGGDVIEVDVPPEALQDGVLYKLYELTSLAVFDRGVFYADYLSAAIGENWEYFTVQTRQQITNAKSGSAYYIRDEEIMIVYLDGDTTELPCKPIYSAKEATETGWYAFYGAYSFIERSLDVKLYYSDSGKVQDLTDQILPTIIQSRDEVAVSGYYYVWGEHILVEYAADAGWDSATVIACTVISNLDEISEDGTYSIETSTKTYNHTNGEMQITERGTYDVVNLKSVSVQNVDIIDVTDFPVEPVEIRTDKFYRKDGEIYKYDLEKLSADDGSSILGNWYFNDTIDLSVSFDVNISYHGAGVIWDLYSPETTLHTDFWGLSISSEYGLSYMVGNFYTCGRIYTPTAKWDTGDVVIGDPRMIYITGGNDVTNETFITWLKSNATRKGAWVKYVPEA